MKRHLGRVWETPEPIVVPSRRSEDDSVFSRSTKAPSANSVKVFPYHILCFNAVCIPEIEADSLFTCILHGAFWSLRLLIRWQVTGPELTRHSQPTTMKQWHAFLVDI